MADMVSAPDDTRDPQRHRGGDTASWIVGVVLILLGVAFLLQNTGVVVLTGNWWALFIYLAAIASFANVWRSYRANKGFGSQTTGSLIWGLVLTVVATIFAFDLEWDRWWPAILMAIGVGMVVGNVLRGPAEGPGETLDG